jgi:hypothetical protein
MATKRCPTCEGIIAVYSARIAAGEKFRCSHCLTVHGGHAEPPRVANVGPVREVEGHYTAAAELLLAGATRLEVHRQLAARGLTFPQAARVVADVESYFAGTHRAAPPTVVAAAVATKGDGAWGDVFAEFVVGFLQGVVEG